MRYLLILLAAMHFGIAQHHQYGYSGQDVPEWAKLMYSESPDWKEVVRLQELYYQNHPYVKNAHTQYFKHWIHRMQIGSAEKSQEQQQNDALYLKKRAEDASKKAASTTANWQCIGPFDYDEDAGSMSYAAGAAHVYTVEQSISNPSVLYAGTSNAGVWKSVDKGLNWTLQTKNMLLTEVYSIEIDRSNPDIVYIGASDGRLMKSINGGTSWSSIGGAPFGNNGNTIKDIALHPGNNTILFVLSESGFYRSTNSGTSFTQIATGDHQEIEFHPTNADMVYTIKYNTATTRTEFYKSINNGVSFALKSTGWPSTGEQKRTEISVSAASANRVYANCTGNVNGGSGTYGTYLSTDMGETWTFQCCGAGPGGVPSVSNKNLMAWADDGSDDGGQYYYDLAYCVMPGNADKVFLGGVNLWHSDNAGLDFYCPSKWSHSNKPEYVHADIHDIKIYGTDIWVSCDGGIWYSNDEGATFNKRFKGIAGTDFWGFGIGYGENGHRVMTGGAYHNGTQVMDNDVYREGWMIMNGGDGTGGEVCPFNDRMIFTDQGAKQLPGNRATGVSNLTFVKKPNNDYTTGKASTIRYSPTVYRTVYLGEGTSLWKSTDAGATFSQLYNFTEHVSDFEISPLNENVMYVATYGTVKKLFRSIDRGVTWTAITLPVALDKKTDAPYDLTPSATNVNDIWIVKIANWGSYDTQLDGFKVFKSNDKGTTWQNISTAALNGEGLMSIAHQHGTNGGVYVSTKRSVYYRNNSMADWVAFNTNLPAQTPSLKVLPDYWSGKLINATSRSVYETEFYEAAPPVSMFRADKTTTTCNGAGINFIDQSSVEGKGGITRVWTFEGGVATSNSAANVWVTYPLAGTFDVTLTITDAHGTHTLTYPDFVTVTGACTATTDIATNTVTGISSENKCYQMFTPQAEFINSGVNTITSFTVKVYRDGVLTSTLPQTVTLTTGQRVTVSLGSVDLVGTSAYRVVAENPNGSADNLSNNTQTVFLGGDFITPAPTVTMVSASSTAAGTSAANVFDGLTTTIWHNNWSAGAPLPHTLVYNLGATYNLGGLDFLNRQDNSNGYPKDVEISTSPDNVTWTTTAWTFTNTANWQTAFFAGSNTRYLRIKVLTTISGASTCSMAEIKVRGCPNAALPVHLLYFTGTPHSDHNALEWASLEESSNLHFTVERSTDGIHFAPIAQLNGAGNSSQVIQYSYLDHDVSSLNLFYRLKQTDENGSLTYSEIILIENNQAATLEVRFHPNPTEGNIEVNILSIENNSITISIQNLQGQLCLEQQHTVDEGENSVRLDIDKLAPGAYLVKVWDEKRRSQTITKITKL